MQIEVKIDSGATEPKVVIFTDKMTDEISELVKRLSVETSEIIAGFRNSEVILLEQTQIIRIYATDSKVYAVTEEGEFQLRLRLYELEARLDKKLFVRISHSEISVSLSGGTTTYVSRRYVSKIKQVLGI